MKSLVWGLLFTLCSVQAFADQTIYCSGQDNEGFIELSISDSGHTFKYLWDGAFVSEIEAQTAIELYANNEMKGYSTINGTYWFGVQVPSSVLDKQADNFSVIVKSNREASLLAGEKFSDCVSLVK